MILTKLHGDFCGRVTEAVTQGFLFTPLHFVCLPTPPCPVQAWWVCCATWTWCVITCLAAVGGWHGPGAQGSGAGGGTVHSAGLQCASGRSRTSMNQRFLFSKEGMTEKVKESSLKHREWILVSCEAPQEEVTTSCGRGCVSEFCEMTVPGPQLSIWPVQLANTSYRSSDLVGEEVLKTVKK